MADEMMQGSRSRSCVWDDEPHCTVSSGANMTNRAIGQPQVDAFHMLPPSATKLHVAAKLQLFGESWLKQDEKDGSIEWLCVHPVVPPAA